MLKYQMDKLATNITNIYGSQGNKWLVAIPEKIAAIQKRFGLTALQPVTNLSHNYVLTGMQGDVPVILKLSHDVDSLNTEAAALVAFADYNAVSILAHADGVLLLSRLMPGHSLKTYFAGQDPIATTIAAKLMQQLHQAPIPLQHNFPHIKDWLTTLDKALNIPEPYLQQAKSLRDNLLATMPTTALLHGDLHHDNILASNDAWLAIDPKGVIGEPCYEIAAFIRNPIPELLATENHAAIIQQRISLFARLLALPEQRIVAWCFVQAVLAWAFSLDDHLNPSYFQQLTQVFARILANRNKQLIWEFYKMEDYLFRNISKDMLDFTQSASVYHTGVDSRSLNFLTIREPIDDIEVLLTTTSTFYYKHQAKWQVSIAEHSETLDIINTFAQLGLKLHSLGTAMVLELAAYRPPATEKTVTIKAVKGKLEDWQLPLAPAFATTKASCASYANVHQIALSSKINIQHFAAYVDSIPIAALTLSIKDNSARIDDIGTNPNNQGKGYATQLITHALKVAKHAGVKYCFLEAHAQEGLGLYGNLGFMPLFTNHRYIDIKSAM